MPKIFLTFVLFLVLSACGGEQSNSTAQQAAPDDPKDSTQASPKSTTREPKWEFAVDGLPVISGRVITAVTVGAYGNYSMAGSNILVSVNLTEGSPNSRLTIKYDDDTRCMNFGDATVALDDDRAVISGVVGCWAPDQKPDDHQEAGIDGWFLIKK